MDSATLSPAELAARLDEDLAAHAAGSCPHYRAKHASPPPDIHYPAGDRGCDGAAGHHPDQAEPGRARLAALAGIAAPEAFAELCRDELTGVDVAAGGWDIRARWFGVVVCATPQLGELGRSITIPWRVIAAQIATQRPYSC
jgi:hypothetical protein